MGTVVCIKCQVRTASVVPRREPAPGGQFRCDQCGETWTVHAPVALLPPGIEPYARRRPDRRAQPRL